MVDAIKVVVLALFVLVIVLIALAVEPDRAAEGDNPASVDSSTFSLECVTGERAANAIGTDGTDVPRQEVLETIAEAEAFLCVDLPQVTTLDGWQPRETNAIRSDALAVYEPGAWVAGENAYKYAEIYYGNESAQAFLSLIIHPNDLAERAGISVVCGPPPNRDAETREQDVKVQGIDATLWTTESPSQGQPSANVCWQEQGLSFFAGVSFQPGFDVQSEILPILNSIE